MTLRRIHVLFQSHWVHRRTVYIVRLLQSNNIRNRMTRSPTQLFLRHSASANLHVLNCSSNNYCQSATNPKKEIHPFRNIHPWKSRDDFIDSLLKNVLYNKDGLVAINKPYGISAKSLILKEGAKDYQRHHIVNACNYTLQECLPKLAKRLDYKELQLAKAPERYTSGIVLLAANEKIKNAIIKSKQYATTCKILCETYWIITTNHPQLSDGKFHLGLTLKQRSQPPYKVPILLSNWSKKKERLDTIHSARVEFNTIFNSASNSSSLVEVKLNKRKWYLLRLFASTILLSPILGDNVHGSRTHKIKGSPTLLDPFHPIVNTVPQLDKELLRLLKVSAENQHIIPVHAELKSYLLPKFRNNDIFIDSPLMPPFDWTCQQLQLNLSKSSENSEINIKKLACEAIV